MSIRVMSAVWETAVTDDPTVLLVMLALADWANDEGVCWPSVSSIAQKCRTSERTVQRIIREMEKVGCLETTVHRGRNRTNIYRIKVPTSHLLRSVNGDKPDIEKVTDETEKVTNGAEFALKGDIAVSPEPPIKQPSVKATIKKKPSKPIFSLPEGVDYAQDWEDWKESRQAKGAKLTDRALELNHRKLMELQARGHSPSLILQLAIERGWTGLYEPPPKYTNGNGHKPEPYDPCRAQDPTAEDIEHYRRQNQE